MGTKYTTTSITGYNATPPPDDGTAVPSNLGKWGDVKTKLSDPINTAFASMDTKLTAMLNVTPVSTSANYTVTSGDYDKTINVTATATITLGDANSLGGGFRVRVRCMAGTTTISRTTGTDTINEVAANITIVAGQSVSLEVIPGTNGFYAYITPDPNASAYTATGTDTYTVTGLSAVTGVDYRVTFTNANTLTTPTLNGTTIVKEGTAALVAGDIPAGHNAILRKTATQFVLLNPVNSVVKLSRMLRTQGSDGNLGTVNAGDRIFVSFHISLQQISGNSENDIYVGKISGTATVAVGASNTVINGPSVKMDNAVRSANLGYGVVNGIMQVTGTGTLNIGAILTSFGTAPTVGTGQLYAIVLNNG